MIEEPAHASDVPAGRPGCPVCSREAGEGMTPFDALPEELRRLISANAPEGVTAVCARCVKLFTRAHAQLEKYAAVFEQGRRVLPTWLRLGADERFTGRGVTIAFLDSGFYQHPDLTTPHSRILAYHNIVPKGTGTLDSIEPASWHGMMTSVVAAGNGALSGGFFRVDLARLQPRAGQGQQVRPHPREEHQNAACVGSSRTASSTASASSTSRPAATRSSPTSTTPCARRSSAPCARG